jgi:hypothetical protein
MKNLKKTHKKIERKERKNWHDGGMGFKDP